MPSPGDHDDADLPVDAPGNPGAVILCGACAVSGFIMALLIAWMMLPGR